jgi:hypothetical protein
MFQNAAKRPEIKKVTVTIRKPVDPKRSDSPIALSQPKLSSSNGKHRGPAPVLKFSRSSLHVPSRKRSSPTESSSLKKSLPPKRKKPQLNVFDSSSDEDSDNVSDGRFSAKRAKASPTPDVQDLSRTIFDITNWSAEDSKKFPLIEGLDMTRHGVAGKLAYAPVFETEDDTPTVVELQYPSNCPPERYCVQNITV